MPLPKGEVHKKKEVKFRVSYLCCRVRLHLESVNVDTMHPVGFLCRDVKSSYFLKASRVDAKMLACRHVEKGSRSGSRDMSPS